MTGVSPEAAPSPPLVPSSALQPAKAVAARITQSAAAKNRKNIPFFLSVIFFSFQKRILTILPTKYNSPLSVFNFNIAIETGQITFGYLSRNTVLCFSVLSESCRANVRINSKVALISRNFND
jgi:hypothetical protein